MSAFARLHPDIQRWIYEQRWGTLRPIQVDAIERFQDSQDDLIISAPTAGGKTEAAFLPVISAMAPNPHGSVRAIYIGPLRALINDQFRRCEDLCLAAEIPVHRWHGDVGQAERKKLVQEPGGILLITPESIESLLINRSSHVRRIFADPIAVVIDELHVFPGTDRGLHLRSLLHRIDLLAGRRIRRIGLSATLGDPALVAAWLRPHDAAGVHIIQDTNTPRELRARIHAYVDPHRSQDDSPPPPVTSCDQSAGPCETPTVPLALETASGMPTVARQIIDIWRHHPEGVNLVFGNSKRDIESCAVQLRQLLISERIPDDRILVHHGSLSRELREETEQLLQAGGHRICLCSSTLELGIDIGSVRAVGQLGAPWSVASFAQRLGRSGRRAGEIPTIRQYIHVADPEDTFPVAEDPIGSLELDLVRAAAVLSLHLDHWCEPIDTSIRDLTVRIQQILSIIAQFNGIRADAIHVQVSALDGLGPLAPAAFGTLLRHLAAQDILEQIGNGDIILGPAGQQIANSRDFYAVFIGSDDYRVLHGDHPIGLVPATLILAPGDGLTLAGRTWRVIDVDMTKRTIEVVPGRGEKPLGFGGRGQLLHQRVVDQMRSILDGSVDVLAMLDKAAVRSLQGACAAYQHLDLRARWHTGATRPILWTWLSGCANLALAELLAAAGARATTFDVGLACEGSVDVVDLLKRAMSVSDEALHTHLANCGLPIPGKYDHLAPAEELVRQHMERDIDLTAARLWLQNCLKMD